MNRKDFDIIARIIRGLEPRKAELIDFTPAMREILAMRVAEDLAKAVACFDREKFLARCGFPVKGGK